MELTKIVEAEGISPVMKDRTSEVKEPILMIYSPKLGEYIPLSFGKPKGEIQEYNIGLAPGSWY